MAWTQTNAANAAFGSGSVSSWANTAFANPLTPGSIILVSLQIDSSGALSVTDTAGNTYLDCGVGPITYATSTNRFQVFYALNSSSTASNVITGHDTVAGTFPAVSAYEYTGEQSGNPIDAFAGSVTNASTSGTGSNNIFTSSAATRANGDLIYVVSAFASGTVTAGTNFTGDRLTNPASEHQIQSSAGSITGTFSNNTSGVVYACIMVALFPQAPIYMLGHT